MMVTMALLAEHTHLYFLYNTNLPTGLYACDIWFLTIRVEHDMNDWNTEIRNTLHPSDMNFDTYGWIMCIIQFWYHYGS
jgi:hypothetical protein